MKRNHHEMLLKFTGASQRAAIYAAARGEERDALVAKVEEFTSRIETMPVTYEQDGKGNNAVAYLHYFVGAWDWWITEKDADPDGEGQLQMFGLTRGHETELGYISLPAILEGGAELDLYFEPKTLREIREMG